MSGKIKRVEIVECYEPGKKPEVASLVAYDETGTVIDTIFSVPRKNPRIVFISTPKGKNPFYDGTDGSNTKSQGTET